MNQPSTASRFFVALAGSLIVVAATWMVRHPSDATRLPQLRAPASNRAGAEKKSRLNKHEEVQREGKATGSFDMSISGEMLEVPSRLRLTGTITAAQNLNAYEFSWILPTGYHVVLGSGAPSGMLSDLQPGQIQNISIVIDRGAEPAQPIVLHVYQLHNGEPIGQVAQFDVPETTFDGTHAGDASSLKNAQPGASGKRDPRFTDQNYVQ